VSEDVRVLLILTLSHATTAAIGFIVATSFYDGEKDK
jgi:hypothetical protein